MKGTFAIQRYSRGFITLPALREDYPMDIVDRKTRSRMMASVRQRHTAPEMAVRSYLHRAGYRFRLHVAALSGRPDIVLPRFKAAIFVHGCFWHGHEGCPKFKLPRTNRKYWARKIGENVERDRRNRCDVASAGWRSYTLWQCQVNEEILRCLAHAIETQARTVGAYFYGSPEQAFESE